MNEHFEQIRLLEALLFASAAPLSVAQLARHFPEETTLEPLLEELQGLYANRGVNLRRVGSDWAFRTAADLASRMTLEQVATRKLSRVATETLAIIAYHQPVTRAEVEEIRGVSLSRGTLDLLLELGWIKPKGRRRTPGRPVTWGTTGAFLDHFGLSSLEALPGMDELKAAGLIDSRPAVSALASRGKLFDVEPSDVDDDEEEQETGETAAELLAADFGEDLLANEGDGPEADDTGAPAPAIAPVAANDAGVEGSETLVREKTGLGGEAN
jgi:segregation and condensation protein B